jgi:hypothetical protein
MRIAASPTAVAVIECHTKSTFTLLVTVGHEVTFMNDLRPRRTICYGYPVLPHRCRPCITLCACAVYHFQLVARNFFGSRQLWYLTRFGTDIGVKCQELWKTAGRRQLCDVVDIRDVWCAGCTGICQYLLSAVGEFQVVCFIPLPRNLGGGEEKLSQCCNCTKMKLNFVEYFIVREFSSPHLSFRLYKS